MPGTRLEVIVPVSAQAGATVPVEVRVTNLLEHSIYVIPVLRDKDTGWGLGEECYEKFITPGETKIWPLTFTMPGNTLRIIGESWFESYYFEWHLDHTIEKTITLGVPMAYCSVDVDAPYSGKPGEVLEAIVTVTNLDTTTDWIFFTEIWAGTELIGSEDDMIPAGTSKTYRRSFTMPDSKITVLGWVERLIYLYPRETVYCGSGSADVFPAVEPEYMGTIIQKEVEYNGKRGSIPVY